MIENDVLNLIPIVDVDEKRLSCVEKVKQIYGFSLEFCLACPKTVLKVIGVLAFYNRINDKLAAQWKLRWYIFGSLQLFYIYRAFYINKSFIILNGYGMVSYGLFCYHIQDLYFLFSPRDEKQYSIPVRDDEIKFFESVLPEHKAWSQMVCRTCMCLVMTYLKMFRIPCYWPFLAGYSAFMFVSLSAIRIQSMVRFGYMPWTIKPKRQTIIIKKKPVFFRYLKHFQLPDVETKNTQKSWTN